VIGKRLSNLTPHYCVELKPNSEHLKKRRLLYSFEFLLGLAGSGRRLNGPLPLLSVLAVVLLLTTAVIIFLAVSTTVLFVCEICNISDP